MFLFKLIPRSGKIVYLGKWKFIACGFQMNRYSSKTLARATPKRTCVNLDWTFTNDSHLVFSIFQINQTKQITYIYITKSLRKA